MFVLMGFKAFGTRLQSLWIFFFFFFFFLEKIFLVELKTECWTKSILDSQYYFHFFLRHVTLTYFSKYFKHF